MQTIEATYRINTPMFIGGADPQQEQDSEIRVPSFKGALRFWWRALAYGRLNGDLRKIKTEEEELFGSTKMQAQLIFSFKNKEYKLTKTETVHEKLANAPGLLYLGYGVCKAFGNKKVQLTRTCINKGQEFTVRIRSKNSIPVHVKQSLQVFGLLGGLGSKARKGYGSITLLSIQEDGKELYSCPASQEAFIQQIKSLTQENTLSAKLPEDKLPENKLPEYTAFSQHTRIDLVESGNDALDLLDQIGTTMQLYHSWGSNGKVNGMDAEKNFPEDHDIAQKVSNDKSVADHPKRIVFGLPHNYYFSSTKNKADFEPVSTDKSKPSIDRRSSPLFIHIHQYSRNEYAALLIILPAKYLPAYAKVNGKKGMSITCSIDANVDYSVLHNFVDGYKVPRDQKSKTAYFPNKNSVLSPSFPREETS